MLKVGTLFSGIETPITALQRIGVPFVHVYACESDKYCKQVILHKFKPATYFDSIKDIRTLEYCDVVIAGPPCQSFSIAGKQLGFKDARGSLFMSFAKLLESSQPGCFVMENVKGLVTHAKGKTFNTVLKRFDAAGYRVQHAVLHSNDYGAPQMRQRLYVIGCRKSYGIKSVEFPPAKIPLRYTLADVLGGSVDRDLAYTVRVGGRGSGYGDKHNWDEYKVSGKLQRLTVEQACRLQGLPASFYDGIDIPERAKFKQLGNAMTVDVIGAVLTKLIAGAHLGSG